MTNKDLGDKNPSRRTLAAVFCSLFVLYLVFTLFGLQSYPRAWIDEGWIAETGWSVATGGHLGNPSHGEHFRFEDRLYWNGPLASIVLGAAYSVGLPPLIGGRLVSVLAGLGTLALMLMWWVRMVTGEGSGLQKKDNAPIRGPTGPSSGNTGLILGLLFIGLAFTLDPFLWKTHRTIRYEALLGLWSMWSFFAAWRYPGPRGAVFAGFLAGLAVLTHPNGILAAAGVVGILWSHRSSFVRLLLWNALALGLTLVPWALYLVSDRAFDYANVLGQNAPHFGETRAWHQNLQHEWRRYAVYFQFPYLLLPLALWIAAAFGSLRVRAPFAWLFPLAVYAGGFLLLPNKTELYLTLAAPLVFLLAAWWGRHWPWKPAVILAALWIGNLAAADAWLVVKNRDCGSSWQGVLTEAVPQDAKVAGTFLSWFDLRDRDFVEFTRRRAGDVYDAAPEYVIWGGPVLSQDNFARLRGELGPFLESHADTVATASSPCYGTLIVYKPHWKAAAPLAAAWERWGSN